MGDAAARHRLDVLDCWVLGSMHVGTGRWASLQFCRASVASSPQNMTLISAGAPLCCCFTLVLALGHLLLVLLGVLYQSLSLSFRFVQVWRMGGKDYS